MSKLLIIGNGFDLNLGLKTSYADFIGSSFFQELANGNNHLAFFLSEMFKFNSKQNQLWIDIEHELKTYSQLLGNSDDLINKIRNKEIYSFLIKFENPSAIIDFLELEFYHRANSKDSYYATDLESLKSRYEKKRTGSGPKSFIEDSYSEAEDSRYLVSQWKEHHKNFKIEFISLKNALSNYLSETLASWDKNESTGNEISKAWALLRFGQLFNEDQKPFPSYHSKPESKSSFTQVFTFNYTNPLSLIGYSSHHVHVDIHYMHGSLGNKDIVFGVDDQSVDNEFLFLTKSGHAAFGKAPDIALSMLAASEIHIFGCSLGDTDNAHFIYPFTELAQRKIKTSRKKTKVIFYVYGKESYQNTFNRLLFLTKGRMSEFKIVNDVFFFDLESDQVINQEWLNNQ